MNGIRLAAEAAAGAYMGAGIATLGWSVCTYFTTGDPFKSDIFNVPLWLLVTSLMVGAAVLLLVLEVVVPVVSRAIAVVLVRELRGLSGAYRERES